MPPINNTDRQPLVTKFRYGGMDFMQVTTHTPDETYPISDLKLVIGLGHIVTVGRANAQHHFGIPESKDYTWWHTYSLDKIFMPWLVDREHPLFLELIKSKLTKYLCHL